MYKLENKHKCAYYVHITWVVSFGESMTFYKFKFCDFGFEHSFVNVNVNVNC